LALSGSFEPERTWAAASMALSPFSLAGLARLPLAGFFVPFFGAGSLHLAQNRSPFSSAH
jgi:hypothetical protein